jgi:CCR4-NOT complex subunit CAF16
MQHNRANRMRQGQHAMSVFVANLTYHHNPLLPPALVDINLSLPAGSRTILVGANGGQTALHLLE